MNVPRYETIELLRRGRDLEVYDVWSEERACRCVVKTVRPPGPAHRGVGTFYYMAPEQARGSDLGAPADVWGLGAVLFEAATGEPVFDDPDADELDSDEPYAESDEPDPNSDEGPTDESEYPQLQGRARRADELRPMPAKLADLIAACLEPEQGRRPGVAEVLRVLEPIAELPAAERRFA
jgi:eukaryotic-like serine/threonine-protein kinase